MKKISVIIPTYNRFDALLRAIDSVVNQTFKDIEIIVINDKSKDERYYTYDFNEKYGDKIKILHTKKNTKEMFGHASAGYVRTLGMKEAEGEYIGFLDDDDIWFPNKLENQLKAMEKHNCKMSCTDGYHGSGPYKKDKKYQIYNKQKHFNYLRHVYKQHNIDISKGLPEVLDKKIINIHNCVIASSVLVDKEILKKVGFMLNLPNGKEDYDCWKKCIEYTNCAYIDDEVYFYYGSIPDHDGRYNYK